MSAPRYVLRDVCKTVDIEQRWVLNPCVGHAQPVEVQARRSVGRQVVLRPERPASRMFWKLLPLVQVLEVRLDLIWGCMQKHRRGCGDFPQNARANN